MENNIYFYLPVSFSNFLHCAISNMLSGGYFVWSKKRGHSLFQSISVWTENAFLRSTLWGAVSIMFQFFSLILRTVEWGTVNIKRQMFCGVLRQFWWPPLLKLLRDARILFDKVFVIINDTVRLLRTFRERSVLWCLHFTALFQFAISYNEFTNSNTTIIYK